MKTKYNHISISLIIIFLFTSCISDGDVGNVTPEDLGKSVLYALKQNDKDLFTEYIYTKYEVEYFIKNYGKPINAERARNRHEEYYPKLIEAFDEIKADAISKGLTNWDNVEFSKVSYSPRSNGIEARSTRLEFTNGKFIGTIKLSTINKSDKGWFMAGVPSFSNYSRMSVP
ncbi:hypothetical protein [Hyunsoonleella ulvae]|uniref:hypothetical protein n=1 Tax=Hyunsoonleella ulvae TaxID=2799948 RepID=UPI00193A258E|nr:hypothetical protein [Hyunsoonleella ulvae]